MYVRVPLDCLVPVEAREGVRFTELESQIPVSHHMGASNQT